MLLKILGTGTSQVTKERTATANYIKIGNKSILLDCGCGTLVRLNQSNISVRDIDIILISHYHIDHISDLLPFLWALKWPQMNRKKDLTIIGPKGFKKFYAQYIKPIVFSKPFELFKIEIKEINKKMKFDNFYIQSYKTIHTKESVAFKFIEKNKSFVIAGDVDYDLGLIKFSKNVDLLILECSYNNTYKVKGHLIPTECGNIAKSANVKKLVLTHFYPIKKETRLDETKKIFKNTIMAKDLIEFKI